MIISFIKKKIIFLFISVVVGVTSTAFIGFDFKDEFTFNNKTCKLYSEVSYFAVFFIVMFVLFAIWIFVNERKIKSTDNITLSNGYDNTGEKQNLPINNEIINTKEEKTNIE